MGAVKDLLVLLGKGVRVREIDKEYQEKKLFGPWGLEELAKLYKGFPKDKLQTAALYYCRKNLLDGLRELAVNLKKKGFILGILSSNPQFIIDSLRRFLPVDFAFGTQLDFCQGIANGKIKRELNMYEKSEILRREEEKYSITSQNVMVIGRATINHLLMAEEAGKFIGFNPETENLTKIINANQEIKKFLLLKNSSHFPQLR